MVCSMGTLAASGGYYIAAACDRIYASAGTITGSIGVISQVPHVEGLLQLVRVNVDTRDAAELLVTLIEGILSLAKTSQEAAVLHTGSRNIRTIVEGLRASA